MADSESTTELTVVFTTFNRADEIDDGLAALSVQEWDGAWDIVLVDNRSTDDTVTVLERWADKMPVPTSIVSARDGQGPSFARNAGVRHSQGVSVAFVDDDDRIGDGWVEAIGIAMRDRDLVGSRHDYIDLNDPALIKDRGNQTVQLGSFYGTPVVSGGGMACRRSVWESVGGSNADFRTGQDIDFSLRAAAKGFEPVLVADAKYSVRLRSDARTAFGQGERMGRALVRLRKVHADQMPSPAGAGRRLLRRWVALALRLRRLDSESNRRRWAFDVGHETGRLRGMVTFRTWAP